ncbi:hypothetical protein P4S72_26800 [Vibrio sp. PP-XX7]
MEREKLTKELLFHIRLGGDSSIEFKAVTFDGNKPKNPNKDKMAHEIAAFANGAKVGAFYWALMIRLAMLQVLTKIR